MNYDASGSKCYDNNSGNCAKYGRLYNWATANNACPSGWHLPKQTEWDVMTAYIGGENIEGRKLKSKSGWHDNGNGTDKFGFSALPGGRGGSGGSFSGIGDIGLWWSIDDVPRAYSGGTPEGWKKIVYSRSIYYDDEGARWHHGGKSGLLSVRCLQD